MAEKCEIHPDDDQARKLEKERFRVFIEEVADGFYETDLKGTFIFFNHALARIFGYPPEEIRNQNYRKFMDGENAAKAFESMNRVYRRGRPETDIIWKITRKDGDIRILEISAQLILDENGNKTGFRGIARDVTEKHKAREELKASEQCTVLLYEASRQAERRYKALLDFFPDPLFVFNLDGTVSYLNPAFEKVFGWTLDELKGRKIPFVPDDMKEQTREGFQRLFEVGAIHGVETRRLTRDGRILDILLDAAIFFEPGQKEPAGQVTALKDVTKEKRAEQTRKALFSIAQAIPRYPGLDDMLEYIVGEVKSLLNAEGGTVILLDEERKEFFFRVAAFDDGETGRKMKEIRYPSHKGVAGHVYRTGKPYILNEASDSSLFLREVDDHTGYRTRNILHVPLWTREGMIGVLCAVNKKSGAFDDADVELLTAVASMAAFPIENARINEALNRSYEEVRAINRAKERVIHHLSHELKTPASVLSASLGLIKKRLSDPEHEKIAHILERARRNLDRILSMQYAIEGILKAGDFRTHHMLTALFDACVDELEALAEEALGDGAVVRKIRKRIDEEFLPRDMTPEKIQLDRFTEKKIQELTPLFSHRDCRLLTRISSVSAVFLPAEVLSRIIAGLIRNAVENTPDGGRIAVTVRERKAGPELEVVDFGVGVTPENRKLVFESNFTTRDTMQYSSGRPYDFNAGGKGFDLLRMKIFSERYGFDIRMTSSRCASIPEETDLCPGDITACPHCQNVEDCVLSGGTSVTAQFKRAGEEDAYLEGDV